VLGLCSIINVLSIRWHESCHKCTVRTYLPELQVLTPRNQRRLQTGPPCLNTALVSPICEDLVYNKLEAQKGLRNQKLYLLSSSSPPTSLRNLKRPPCTERTRGLHGCLQTNVPFCAFGTIRCGASNFHSAICGRGRGSKEIRLCSRSICRLGSFDLPLAVLWIEQHDAPRG
jgi:hypothetical protein